MVDLIKTKQLNVYIQENGIIRNSAGLLIGRLVDDVNFDKLYNEHTECAATAVSFLNQYKANALRTEARIDTVEVNEMLFISVMQQMLQLGGIMDMIKKNVFYGKEYDTQDFQRRVEYISESFRTMETITNDELNNDAHMLPVNPRIFHGIVGMMTEAVELMEALKPYSDDSSLDRTNILEEIGDSLWYQAIIIDELGGEWEDIFNRNIEKLQNRFPEKFTSERAINRDVDSERIILDKITRDG